jgi:hypothetical protein
VLLAPRYGYERVKGEQVGNEVIVFDGLTLRAFGLQRLSRGTRSSPLVEAITGGGKDSGLCRIRHIAPREIQKERKQ